MNPKSLQSLFGQKSWANHELFNALSEVTDPQHADALHTALRTLNHILVVDRIFKAHLSKQAHDYTATNTADIPELDAMQMAAAETDAWYEAYVATVSPQTLSECVSFQFTDGDTGSMSREEMLLHVITHGAYHRGNVGQVLKSLSVAPPRDLLTKFLHLREPQRRSA
jgi:uncharacterized damage-inducible protein DinB